MGRIPSDRLIADAARIRRQSRSGSFEGLSFARFVLLSFSDLKIRCAMDTNFATLNIDRPRAHVMLVTLNRPASANAMNSQLGTEIMTLFESLNLDAGDTRCIVVTGAGDRAFCAGADLKERKDMTDEAWTKQHLIYERMVRAILGCPIPIIAAVNGAA